MADKIIAEFRDRLSVALEQDWVRDQSLEDIRFIYDTENFGQWDEGVLNKRQGRPNYTFNRVIGAVNQVIGDQRQNKPTIKVRGVDSEADPQTAEIYNGLIRNIENISDAETAYDTAFKMAATGGYGVWKITPEYSADDTFDQDIYIRRIPNPFTAYCDPSAKEYTKKDANWWIITERISKDEFRVLYPKASTDDVDFDDKDGRYITTNEVRIAEYWRKKPKKQTLALLSDGRTVLYDADFKQVEDELAELDVTVVRTREVDSHTIEWVKVSGAEVLEGPIEYNWKYIPIVPVYGRTINIEGAEHYEGVIRHAKDAQRSYNYNRSTAMEITAIQPKAPYMVTPKMIKDHEEMWRQANVKNYPFLLYDIDPSAPMAKPSREAPPQIPVGMVAQAQQDADDIRATTGFFAPSLGEPSNEVSGVAIAQRQTEGDVGSFEYVDNLGKSIRFSGEILVDMIPKVYDTERQIRILGIDGSESFETINQQIRDEETGEIKTVNDLSTGKYDVAVTLGPSFTTQRQEALAGLIEISKAIPLVAEIAADQIVKNVDVPGADEIEKRVRTALIQSGAIQPGEDDDDIVEALQSAQNNQNQAVNAELESQRIEAETQLRREAIEAQGDVEKEQVKAADAEAERQFKAEQARLDRELEREKMDLKREELRVQTIQASQLQ